MSETVDRVAQLDACKSWSISVGEREFWVKPLPFPRLKEIVGLVLSDDKTTEEEVADGEVNAKKPIVDLLFEDWEKSLHVFCLIFGYEKTNSEYEIVYKHLHDCLTHPDALETYDRFYEVNRLQDFFNRAGRLLLTTNQARLLREHAEPTLQ